MISRFDIGLKLTTKLGRLDLVTVREIARLQGFSDDFVFYNSVILQYKDVFTAQPPIVAKQVAEVILQVIRSSRVIRLDEPGVSPRINKRPRFENEGERSASSLSSAPNVNHV